MEEAGRGDADKAVEMTCVHSDRKRGEGAGCARRGLVINGKGGRCTF